MKVDKADRTKTLPGAKFILKRYEKEDYQMIVETYGQEDEKNEATEYVTGVDGKVCFQHLTKGYYELIETRSPDGYVKTTANPRFQIIEIEPETEDGEKEFQIILYDDLDGMVQLEDSTLTVANEKGTELPMTGGPGTEVFIQIGSILAGIAGAIICIRKNKGRKMI